MENLQTDRELRAEIKLYYDLYLPEDGETKPRSLLISIHGYGGNKRAMMREGRAVAPENWAVAALQGFHQHFRRQEDKTTMPKVGFSWLTNHKPEESVATHHKVVRDLINNLRAEGVADKVYLLGFSQSCALNFRFAFSYPKLVNGVIGISGGVPGDWETNEIYKTLDAPVFYLYGDTDEFYTLEQFQKNAERLKLRAANLQTKGYTAPHEITDEMRQDIKAWLNNLP
jgi:predicted esterase